MKLAQELVWFHFKLGYFIVQLKEKQMSKIQTQSSFPLGKVLKATQACLKLGTKFCSYAKQKL